MFSRSHSKSNGFGSEKDKAREAVQLSALAELGLIRHDESKSRSSGGSARRTDFHRPNYASSSAARFIGGATYPEKCRWTSRFRYRSTSPHGCFWLSCWMPHWSSLLLPCAGEHNSLTLLISTIQTAPLPLGPFALRRTARLLRSPRSDRERATRQPLAG